jgi:hypothetical protein
MRQLSFTVNGQRLSCDPACDFTGIVSNSRGYLRARFRFSADWKGCKKVAIFTGPNGEEMVPLAGDCCQIPDNVLTGNIVQVAVVGQSGAVRISTNTIEFKQKTGR